MSYTNGLDKPDLYFNTKLYTGNGSTNAITGVNFQPDWVWLKSRSDVANHGLHDVLRVIGSAEAMLSSNTTSAETTGGAYISSFDTDGFTLNSNTSGNGSGQTYASWNWKANGAGSSNTDGSITSTVSANTTSGFSIVSYTGNGTSGATIGHSLGTTPSMIITKQRNSAGNWFVYHKSLPVTEYIILNSTVASQTDNEIIYNDTTPSSTTFTVGNYSQINGSSNTFISYCFAEKKGFSKFGSYTGNGSADGTFVYLGFKPAFVMLKRSSSTSDWYMFDSKREGYNVDNDEIYANLNYVEDTADRLDILSNGFKMRTTGGNLNGSGETFIYMAFASSPFTTSSGVPTTAR